MKKKALIPSVLVLFSCVFFLTSDSVWTAKNQTSGLQSIEKAQRSNPSQTWHMASINASDAWQSANGSGVKIAVVDEAFDLDHPDFAGQIQWHNQPAGTSDVLMSHGTHVLGNVGANATNTNGVRSIAYGSDFYLYKVNTQLPISTYTGVRQAAMDGADVINVSIGWAGSPHVDVVNLINQAASYGSIIVAPAGNSTGGTEFYPAQLPNVISVAGYDVNSVLVPGFVYNDEVDVSAPAVSVYTTTPNGQHDWITGTSHAAPIVAGVIALMKEKNSCIDVYDARDILKTSADSTIYNVPGNAGKKAGAGKVNASAAVDLAEVYPTNKATAVSGSSLVSPSGSTLYSVNLPNANVSDVTITWAKSSNLQYLSGQGSKNYYVRASGSGNGWVEARLTNCEGYTKTIRKTVWAGKPIAPTILGPSTIYSCNNTNRFDLSSTSIANKAKSQSTLTWSVVNGTDVTFSPTLPYRWVENYCDGLITIRATFTNQFGSATGKKYVNSQGCHTSCGGILPPPGLGIGMPLEFDDGSAFGTHPNSVSDELNSGFQLE